MSKLSHLHNLLANGVNLDPGKNRTLSQYAKFILLSGKKKQQEEQANFSASTIDNNKQKFPKKIFEDPNLMHAFKNTLGMCKKFMSNKDKSLGIKKRNSRQKLRDRDCFALLNDKAKILNYAGTEDDLFKSVCLSSKKHELGKMFGKDYNRNKKFEFVKQAQKVQAKKHISKWPVKRIGVTKVVDNIILIKKNASERRRHKLKYDNDMLRLKLVNQLRRPRNELSISFASNRKQYDLNSEKNSSIKSNKIRRVSSTTLIERIQRLTKQKDEKNRFLKLKNYSAIPAEKLKTENNAISRQYFMELNKIQKILDSLLHEHGAMKAMLKSQKQDPDFALSIKEPVYNENKKVRFEQSLKNTQSLPNICQHHEQSIEDNMILKTPYEENKNTEDHTDQNKYPVQQYQPIESKVLNLETKVYKPFHGDYKEPDLKTQIEHPNESEIKHIQSKMLTPYETISSKSYKDHEPPHFPAPQESKHELFKPECKNCKPKPPKPYSLRVNKPPPIREPPKLAVAKKWFTEVENKNENLNFMSKTDDNKYPVKFCKTKNDTPKKQEQQETCYAVKEDKTIKLKEPLSNKSVVNIKENCNETLEKSKSENIIEDHNKNDKIEDIKEEHNLVKLDAEKAANFNFGKNKNENIIEKNIIINKVTETKEEQNLVKFESKQDQEKNNLEEVTEKQIETSKNTNVDENIIKKSKNEKCITKNRETKEEQNLVKFVSKNDKENNLKEVTEKHIENSKNINTNVDETKITESKNLISNEKDIIIPKEACIIKVKENLTPLDLTKNNIILKPEQKELSIIKVQSKIVIPKEVKSQKNVAKKGKILKNVRHSKNYVRSETDIIKNKQTPNQENTISLKKNSCIDCNKSIFKLEKIKIKNVDIVEDNEKISLKSCSPEENYILPDKDKRKEIGAFVFRSSSCKAFDRPKQLTTQVPEIFLKTDTRKFQSYTNMRSVITEECDYRPLVIRKIISNNKQDCNAIDGLYKTGKPNSTENISSIKRVIMCIYRDCNLDKKQYSDNFLRPPKSERSLNCLREIVPDSENGFYVKRSKNSHIYCKGSLKSKRCLSEISKSNTNNVILQKDKELLSDIFSFKNYKKDNYNVVAVNKTSNIVLNNIMLQNNNSNPWKNVSIKTEDPKRVVELFKKDTPTKFLDKITKIDVGRVFSGLFKSPLSQTDELKEPLDENTELYLEMYMKEFISDIEPKVDKNMLKTISSCMESAYKRITDKIKNDKLKSMSCFNIQTRNYSSLTSAVYGKNKGDDFKFKPTIQKEVYAIKQVEKAQSTNNLPKYLSPFKYRIHDPYFNEIERETTTSKDLFLKVKTSFHKKPENITEKSNKSPQKNVKILSDRDLFKKLQNLNNPREHQNLKLTKVTEIPEPKIDEPILAKEEKSLTFLERLEESKTIQLLKKISTSLKEVTNIILRIDDEKLKPEMILKECDIVEAEDLDVETINLILDELKNKTVTLDEDTINIIEALNKVISDQHFEQGNNNTMKNILQAFSIETKDKNRNNDSPKLTVKDRLKNTIILSEDGEQRSLYNEIKNVILDKCKNKL